MTFRQGKADGFRSDGGVLPDNLHEELFEFTEWLSRLARAEHRSATECSVIGARCQGVGLRAPVICAYEWTPGGGRRYLPYAFTERGVAMLSSVLQSDRAVQMNINSTPAS